MANDPIQEIKDIANIVELISEIIPVKRSGTSYVSLCPFHNDKHPSMHISAPKGIYKCFSCGAGGDVFKFWSEYYQKDFAETLKDLANKYGVTLENSNYSKEDTERFNLKIQMHEIAAKFYHEQLLASSQAVNARKYLEDRNISTATISSFKFGYSPDEPDRLIKILKESLSINEEAIVSAGLAIKSENTNGYFDRFRSRLMIPIFDERSRVIGFGARILDPDSKLAKYINSPETEIYNKGSNLYGLNLAKEEIRKKDSVILVEGFFDLISLYQAGFKNIVANQGTALTQKQIKMLAKYSASKKIYLCLDSDKAGQEASDRAAELIYTILKDTDFELRLIKVPNGKDPDDFIRSNSHEAFETLIDRAPLYIEYKINTVIQNTDLSSVTAKAKSIKELAKYLSFVTNKIIFVEYRKLIAEKLSVDENALAFELDRSITNNTNPYQETPQRATQIKLQKPKIANPSENIELDLLILFFKERSFMEKFLSLELTMFNQYHNILFDKLVDISFENPLLTNPEEKFKLVYEALSDHRELIDLLSTIGAKLEQENQSNNHAEYFNALVKRHREAILKKQIAEIKFEIAQLSGDDQFKLEMIQKELQLKKELHAL